MRRHRSYKLRIHLMTTKADAYHRGYDAALAGDDLSANPYTSDNSGALWASWKFGWTDATSNKSPRFSKRKISTASLFQGVHGSSGSVR